MKCLIYVGKLALVFVAAGVLAAGPAFARKPARAGNENYEKEQRQEEYQNRQYHEQTEYEKDDRSKGADTHRGPSEHGRNEKRAKDKKAYDRPGKTEKDRVRYSEPDKNKGRHSYFKERDREVIRTYFSGAFRRGHCPPGLAKKDNGCMPPGQVKKWKIGKPLPREVIFYDLPSGVLQELPPPPARHRYVRVAEDILLITAGVGMVVDAIEDLGSVY